jgi:hypothetical protein
MGEMKKKKEKFIALEIDVFSIRDATLDTTTPIGGRAERTIRASNEGVVMATPWYLCPTEPRTDLECFSGRDGEHGVCELGFEFIKDGFTEPCWYVSHDACYSSTYGVLSIFCEDDTLRSDQRRFVEDIIQVNT